MATNNTWLWATILASTLAASCSQEDAAESQEPAGAVTQKGVFYPEPRSDAEKVDWTRAGLQIDGENPASDFRRGQHLMAMLADNAYQDDAYFAQEAIKRGFVYTNSVHTETGTFGKTDADAVLGRSVDGKMNFVAIRGSSKLDDFALDAFVVPSPPWSQNGAPITLHQGFAQYADAVYEGVRGQLTASCSGEAGAKIPLFITGHSLGGAAASILAYRLAQEGCNVAGVSMFGALRAGQTDWQRAYAGTVSGELPLVYATQRWVRKDDPFYCLPIGGAWKHVGFENRIDNGIHLGSTGDFHCDTPEGWVGGIKRALEIADKPTSIAIGIQRAISDWLSNLIELSMVCLPGTNWDEVWSLGACSVVNSGNDFIQTYGVTPAEFLGEVVNLITLGDHKMGRYANDLSADFSEPVDNRPIVNLHMFIENVPAVYASARLVETNSGAYCIPDPDASGGVFCDFPVRQGSGVRFEWVGYNDYYGYLAGNCPHPSFNTGAENDRVCEFVVDGEMSIGFRTVSTLF